MKTESGKDQMLTLVGKGVSPGLAKGTAFVYIDVLQRDSKLSQIDPAEVDEELARIERAIDDVRQRLTIDAKHIEDKFDKSSADIFRAHEALNPGSSGGASGHRLESVSEFVPLVQSCFDERGVQVIDVPVDYSENNRILHHEIQKLNQQI